ncbi:DUF2975 domain-containing protein [Flavihumibacter profundi]|uniref:DUF2975 domain-containing protein n=1 Tax=Flavihumibacter profundi TaxID=2716883 RepID=UPI001CC5005E|nr:DUF2975 domain-containing protein [Flavihumibacter profundi]MBZ5858459.1 DUF2975 domain-containing protein [Flavihumibacter profundi]
MEIKITTGQILNVLAVLSWIIFIGVCIEAGGFISNTVYTMVINPKGASNFWEGNDLSPLYNFDRGYFLVQTSIMCIVAMMRATIFYLIIKMLQDKKLNMSQPFNKDVLRVILNIAYLALGIGLFSWWGVKHAAWFTQQGVKMPDIQYLRLGGADVWLFMGVTLIVIAQVFRRGIEIQTENELTV